MHAIPTPNSSSEEITLGLDGDLWFGESGANKIGQLVPSGSITEYAVPTPDSDPSGITLGPDGAIWFCEWTGNKIGRITTAGVITEFWIPTANSDRSSITIPSIWMPKPSPAEQRTSSVGRTDQGRFLVVITTLRHSRIRIVTAFPAPKNLIDLYYTHKGTGA